MSAITGGAISVLAGSYVYATGVDSDVYMKARTALIISGALDSESEAIIKGDRLVHLVAPTVEVSGIVQAGIDGVGEADGRVLFNAGSTLDISGFVTSDGTIDLNSGVNMNWDRVRLEKPIASSDLSGGDITISGQGLVNALGAITLQAGGEFCSGL